MVAMHVSQQITKQLVNPHHPKKKEQVFLRHSSFTQIYGRSRIFKVVHASFTLFHASFTLFHAASRNPLPESKTWSASDILLPAKIEYISMKVQLSDVICAFCISQ